MSTTTAIRLEEAIRSGQKGQAQQILTSDPEALYQKTTDGISMILLAAYYRNASMLSEILSFHPVLSLHEAAATGNTERTKNLLEEHLLPVDAFSEDGFTALGLACFFGHSEIVHLLLQKGANINLASANAVRVTPLHSAVAAQQPEITEILLQHGAEVEAQQPQGFTPLHQAAHAGHLQLVELLLRYGASCNTISKDGHTPLDMAQEKGWADVAAILEKCQTI
jgi:uncharacterized protein